MKSTFLRAVLYSTVLYGTAFVSQPQQVAKAQDRPVVARPGLFKALVEPPCSYCVNQNLKGLIRSDDPVIAWIRAVHNGGAIPLRYFLSDQRIINDTYGLFFYDPDGGYVAAYKKDYGYTFEGWRGGVMVVRGRDGTLWSALTGLAFKGPKKGQRLERIPSLMTNWSHWLMLHPESTAYDLFDGKRYIPKPLPTAMEPLARASMGRADPRLSPLRTVLGVWAGGKTMAFPLDESLSNYRQCFTDHVGGKEVAVFWYGATKSAVAFETTLDGQHLTFYADSIAPETAPFMDKETRTRWTLAGRGIDGPLRGKELKWVDSIACRWYAWSGENPETAVHSVEKDDARAATFKTTAVKGELLSASTVTREVVTRLKQEGANTLVLRLDDDTSPASLIKAVSLTRGEGLRAYYWVEVGRNRAMADAHPEWMASLQGHTEWRRIFPQLRAKRGNEVVKTYPWIPVSYAPAFKAHLARLKRLLMPLPAVDGLFLNHLQAAPSACGCGNILCRWTPGYGPIQTAESLPATAAAQFVAAAMMATGGAEVVPVWITECEEHEMAENGACAGVSCYSGACWRAWSEQLGHVARQTASIAVLAPFRALGQTDPKWVGGAVASFEKMPPQREGVPIAAQRLVAVLQGWSVTPAEIATQRDAAARAGAGGWLVARTPLDQSWQPKIMLVAEK